jgi:hypothetical protein
VNSDKTRIHLVPNDGEKTWEPKGSTHVQVLGLEDERQMTMVVSSNIGRNLLPPQIMFTSSTPRTLPLNSNGKTSWINNGWDLIFIENLWSSLETTKQFVEKSSFLTYNPKSNFYD